MNPPRHDSFDPTLLNAINRRRFLGRLALSCGSFTAAGLLSPSRVFADDAPVVETTYGKVRGSLQNGISSFKGLRYGGPTGGKNRFMPPVKPEPWTGIQDALEFGSSAPQSPPTGSGARGRAGGRAPGESEDCLFLNVWTPGINDGPKRPVMVWLHGGGFTSGSGSGPGHDGTNLARRGDVVVVTINHRLGVLAYTHFGDLAGTEYAHSGNAGSLDIMAALQWVRDNISQFGGDPQRVMIFGESGGGNKVGVLMASPPAHGLFHRAVIQSGSGALRMNERDNATRTAEVFLKALDLDKTRLKEIHDLPLAGIMAAQFKIQPEVRSGLVGSAILYTPVLDPVYLPQHPFHPAASPVSADVPLIVGYNHTESTLWIPNWTEVDEPRMRAGVKRLFGDKADKVIDVYRRKYPTATAADINVLVATDYPLSYRAILMAQRKAALGGAPVYAYRFDWETPVRNLRSPHTLEVPFVFDNIKENPVRNGGGPEAMALAARVSEAWISFARTGDPNTPKSGLPHWPPYDLDKRATMLFNNDSRVANDPVREERLIIEECLPPGASEA